MMFLMGLAASSQITPLHPVRPVSIAFDTAGNLYFTDAGRNQVYTVSLAGVLSVVAGSGVQGFGGDGGSAVSAQLNEPKGIAVGANGVLYIADSGNSRIRSVRDGVITTIAGNGIAGFSGDGGPGTAAQLSRPAGLAVSADDLLYVADSGNQRVRLLRSGTITTLAGNGVEGFSGDGGPATQAALNDPEGVALAPDGRLLIADTHNQRLRAVSDGGAISTVAGSGAPGFGGDGGPSAQAQLFRPCGVAVSSSGKIYIADSGNQRLRVLGVNGALQTVAGAGVQGVASEGSAATGTTLDGPASVAVSPLGLVWFADGRNNTVRAVTGDGLVFQPAGLVPRSSILATRLLASMYGQTALSVVVAGQAGVAQGAVRVRENGVLLAEGSLAGGGATLLLAAATTGAHALTVEYGGDVLNPASISPLGTVTVAPAVLIATADPSTMRYGDDVPLLTGTITGVPAPDVGRVQASFIPAAAALTGVGVFPITVSLTGPAAANYTVQLSPASGTLTVTAGQSRTAMLTPAPSGYDGLPLTVSALVAPATRGKPSGVVTFTDNGVMLATATLVNGSATAVIPSAAVGQHAVAAHYSGDANFLPSESPPQTVAVNLLPDFTMTQVSSTVSVSPVIPTMNPGTAATFNFRVAAAPAPFTGAVAFAVAGLPTGWTARFAPANVIPGTGSANVVLTVTASGTARVRAGPASGLVIALLFVPLLAYRKRSKTFILLCVALSGPTALMLGGCGDRVASMDDLVPPHPASFTVSGTATNLAGQVVSHTVTVSYLQP